MMFSLTSFKTQSGGLDPRKVNSLAELFDAQTFVETGTYLGETVAAMVETFKEVYSIELSAELHHQARSRFQNDSGVKLLLGDSSAKLAEVVSEVQGRNAVYWLDAHWSGGNTAKAEENTPIVKELTAISSAELGDSLIMVDDLRYFINIPAGFELHEANSGYPLLRDLLAYIEKLWPGRVAWVNGDILFILPPSAKSRLTMSDVLSATHTLRSGLADDARRGELENVIATAEGDERETLLKLPEIFSHSLRYGIGGEYAYWRALVRERDGALHEARDDFELARRCGLQIPRRSWE